MVFIIVSTLCCEILISNINYKHTYTHVLQVVFEFNVNIFLLININLLHRLLRWHIDCVMLNIKLCIERGYWTCTRRGGVEAFTAAIGEEHVLISLFCTHYSVLSCVLCKDVCIAFNYLTTVHTFKSITINYNSIIFFFNKLF